MLDAQAYSVGSDNLAAEFAALRYEQGITEESRGDRNRVHFHPHLCRTRTQWLQQPDRHSFRSRDAGHGCNSASGHRVTAPFAEVI